MFDRALNMPLDYLSCFGMVLRGIMEFILNLAFSPYSDSYRKYNIQVNGSLTKIKEKLSTIQFDVFDLSIIFSIPNKCHKQKRCMLFFTHIKLVARVLVCACVTTCIKWGRLLERLQDIQIFVYVFLFFPSQPLL